MTTAFPLSHTMYDHIVSVQDVWNVMKAKDRKYLRDKQLIDRHPQLQSRMRAILLDWIIEVCISSFSWGGLAYGRTVRVLHTVSPCSCDMPKKLALAPCTHTGKDAIVTWS